MAQVTTADGTPIGYEKQGSGPPLVMVHGGSMNHQTWGPVVPLLAEHFTLYLMDQRGRGESAPYTAAYRIEQSYRDIASLIDAVGEPVYLLAHSMGARHALHAALLTPNVRKMALYEPPPFEPLPRERLKRMRDALAAGDVDKAVTIILSEDMRMPAAAVEGIRQSPMWQVFASNAANTVTEFAAFDDYRFDAAEFHNLRVPTLIIVGGNSPAFMYEQTAQVNAALPNSHIVEIAGETHTAFRGQPDLFASIVTSFFLG